MTSHCKPRSSASTTQAPSSTATSTSKSIARMAETYEDFGVLHVDAHADLRPAYEGFEWSHASIMFNVIRKIPQVKKLVQVGIRDFAKTEVDFVSAAKGRIV